MSRNIYIGVVMVIVVVLSLTAYVCIFHKKTNLDTVPASAPALTEEQKEVEEWRKREFSKPIPKSKPINFN